MTEQSEQDEQAEKMMEFMTELGNQLTKTFRGQEIVLITYDKFTNEVIHFLSSNPADLLFVFNQILDRLKTAGIENPRISKRVGNA